MASEQDQPGAGGSAGENAPGVTPPGVVHSYQRYDPAEFPMPTAEPPDLSSAAMEWMMRNGSTRELTEEELARAVRLDASMFPRLGPSLESLIQTLEERKARILAEYETRKVEERAERAYGEAAKAIEVPDKQRGEFHRAVREQQIGALENLYYRQRDDQSPFAMDLVGLIERLGEKYQVEALASNYAFTGRTPMTVPEALEIKQELETIDELLKQLREAMKNAQIAVIDLDELSEFADPQQIEELNEIQRQVEEYVRREAERQGLERTAEGFRLTPQAMRTFQGKLLTEIFSELSAARTGRHEGPIVGEGPVEMAATKPYEFGDSLAHLDLSASFVNAMIRGAAEGAGRLTLMPGDIEVHRTRNTPKCATTVLMDMSGSMRHGGQYVNVKRMALAFDGLIRREYPGDHLSFIELFTFAKVRTSAELVTLLPKPVSIFNPVVRLRVDMSDPNVPESRVPQHFTNIQRGLQLARRVLSGQDTPNRQVMLITDGLPTAHYEGEQLYMLYPPDPRTEEATMREALACAREGITINVFLLPSWSQSSEDVAFAHRMAESTKGRVFFTGGRDLDRFVLWDYVKQRRRVIG